MIEAFLTLVHSAKKMGLVIHSNKTKYITTDKNYNNRSKICINGYTFGRVDHFS